MGKTPGGTLSGASTPVEGTPDVEDPEDPVRYQPAITVHDNEGEGEEDEEMTHSVRAKVFKMVNTDDRPCWVDMGIGAVSP
jgi:nucleoporin NUP2